MLKPARVLSILAAGGLFIGVMSIKINTPDTPPLFNNLRNFALFAQEEMKLDKGVQISSGDTGSNNNIDIQKDVVINGNLFADKITIDKNTAVNGNVSFNKLKTQKETQILGTQTKPVQLPIANLPDIPWITPGEGDFRFQGQNNTLPAGNYRDITVDKDSKLVLSGGSYHIRKLELKDNSTLIFNAPTTLNVLFKLRGRNRVAILPGSNLKPDDFSINYLGLRDKKDKNTREDDDDEINSRFDDDKERKDHKDRKIGHPVVFGPNSFLNFKLLAPKASVHLEKESTLRGQVVAKKVKIGKETVVSREELFEKESDPAKVVEDQGLKFIVNEIIVLFEDTATQSDVQQIADLVSGSIIGFIPTPKIVKIEVQTSTAQELNNKIEAIKSLSSPLIVEVVQNLVAQ